MSTPWRSNDAQVAAGELRGLERLAREREQRWDWTPPNGETQRKVQVLRGERTCLECYETFAAGHHCERCGDGGRNAPSVPTTFYLHEEEYVHQ